jgi:hypothetical protein
MMETAPGSAGVLGEHLDRCVQAQRTGQEYGRSSGPRPEFTPAVASLGAVLSKTRQGKCYSHLQSCIGELVREPNGKSRFNMLGGVRAE